jgi:hypothetical protein
MGSNDTCFQFRLPNRRRLPLRMKKAQPSIAEPPPFYGFTSAAQRLSSTPHYSIIERSAMKLGRDLSRQAQERGAREVAARCTEETPCPTCQALCPVATEKRTVRSTDGPVELTEAVAFCRSCKRSFFPSARRPGNG